MIKPAEQLAALNQANVETVLGFTNAILEGTERLINLQLSTAKDVLAENAKTARALLGAKDVQELLAMQTSAFEPNLDKTLAYMRSVLEVANQTQAEMTKLVESRFGELNLNLVTVLDRLVKTAPTGSEAAMAAVRSAMAAANSAYDTMSKAAKQAAELAEGSAKKKPVTTK